MGISVVFMGTFSVLAAEMGQEGSREIGGETISM
jgi:hypothetical protein